MRFIYLFVFSFILFSCNKHQIPEYERIADAITAKTAKKMASERNLQLIGIGGGMMDNVRMMAMSFNYDHELTIEEGRELVVYCVEKYLSAINSNEQIRPYLKNYPFRSENIEIRIFLYKPGHQDVPIGALSVVGAYTGTLAYKTREEESISLKRVHEETYQEALEILAQTGSRVTFSSSATIKK